MSNACYIKTEGADWPLSLVYGIEHTALLPELYYFPMCYLLRQPARDLFGEVPVTEDDLEAWVAAVSPVHLTERLFANYVRRYNVADKIRTAKLRGEFDAMTAVRREPYHARLALSQIV